jgi:hypothetical protein
MKHYEELCLASYGQTKGGVFKKNPLPTPKKITFSADPERLLSQDQSSSCSYGYTNRKKSFCSTLEIGSSADARDACVDCSSATVTINTAYLNPS